MRPTEVDSGRAHLSQTQRRKSEMTRGHSRLTWITRYTSRPVLTWRKRHDSLQKHVTLVSRANASPPRSTREKSAATQTWLRTITLPAPWRALRSASSPTTSTGSSEQLSPIALRAAVPASTGLPACFHRRRPRSIESGNLARARRKVRRPRQPTRKRRADALLRCAHTPPARR